MVAISTKNAQQDFFDLHQNQYSEQSLLSPPEHTKQEIKLMMSKIKDTYKKGQTIIDFGSGSGRMTIPLLQQKCSVLAVDISKKSLETLQKMAKRLKLDGLKTNTELPTDKKYDMIIGSDILHHVEFDEYFPLFFNTLKDGGKIIFTEPGALNPTWYIYLTLFQNWEVERGVLNCTYANFVNKLKKYGFKNIKLTGLGFIPRPFFNWSPALCRFNDWLGNVPIIKLFAYRYIVEATK